jgi:hypothetical protein
MIIHTFSRTVGRGIVEVAYGEKILGLIGDELLSWNDEAMHLYEENFVKFWLVDIFNFRSSILPCFRISLFSYTHSSLHTKLGSRRWLQVRTIYQYYGF